MKSRLYPVYIVSRILVGSFLFCCTNYHHTLTHTHTFFLYQENTTYKKSIQLSTSIATLWSYFVLRTYFLYFSSIFIYVSSILVFLFYKTFMSLVSYAVKWFDVTTLSHITFIINFFFLRLIFLQKKKKK